MCESRKSAAETLVKVIFHYFVQSLNRHGFTNVDQQIISAKWLSAMHTTLQYVVSF